MQFKTLTSHDRSVRLRAAADKAEIEQLREDIKWHDDFMSRLVEQLKKGVEVTLVDADGAAVVVSKVGL